MLAQLVKQKMPEMEQVLPSPGSPDEDSSSRLAPSNPFVSRCIRPGSLPYIFPWGDDIGRLMAALRDRGWMGQIVGPHGSGKSTLIESLLEPLERAGRQIVRYRLSSKYRQTIGDGTSLVTAVAKPVQKFAVPSGGPDWDRNTQVIVDGWEQLFWWQRWAIYARCCQRKAGLLVTAHRRTWALPLVYRTNVDLRSASEIVRRLAGNTTSAGFSDRDLLECLTSYRGNMRECLFRLYDLWELRQSDREG